MKKIIIFYFKVLLLSLIVSIPLILPYFKTGYFPTHDGEWAVVRLSDMYREVKDLQFPARYSGYLNFQYGYPLFNFAYPLPYYLGLIFVFLKFGFVGSIKLLFALSVIFSFFSMFLLSDSLWRNKWAGLVSAVLYIYVPYRLVDLYVRGSIGESLSFVLFPLIILGVKRIYEEKDLVGMLFTGTTFGLLIATHNIMTVLFGLFIGFIFLWALFAKKIEFFVRLTLSFIFSLCLAAFFWIPAIFEKNMILLSKIPIADRNLYFVNPLQLIIPKWGYGVPTDPNGFGYQIGLAQAAVFLLVLFLVVKNIVKHKDRDELLGLFLIISTLCLSLLFFSFTSFVWSHTPFLSEINYPWTMLAIVMFTVSLMAGYLVNKGKVYLMIGLLLTLFAVVVDLPYAKPSGYVNRGDAFYLTNQGTTTSSNELMPLWVKQQPLRSWNKKVEVSSGTVSDLTQNSKKISFSLSLPKAESVTINTIYYPGWKISVDGRLVGIGYNNPMGVMEIAVLSGQHYVKGFFTETPLRLFSDIISLISFLGLVIYFISFPLMKAKKLWKK